MSPPGYQAPVVKASWCRNEREERFGNGKRVLGKWKKDKIFVARKLVIESVPLSRA